MNANLLQIFTRIYLGERSLELGRPATLSDIPDWAIDQWAAAGFHIIWMLGIWQTGDTGRNVSRTQTEWLTGFRHTLPDFTEADICGSPFAITDYALHQDFGNDEDLAKFRDRLHQRDLRLLLDFVPNHTAIDHPWVTRNPEFYVDGSIQDLRDSPQNYFPVETDSGPRILAHGRDPNFYGWPDTAQLNYRLTDVHRAMQTQLTRIAAVCDGVRCDMAMLVLPEVFRRTWNQRPRSDDLATELDSFWLSAIPQIRKLHPEFIFMAEVYWDMERELLQQGFDLAYDKRLYDGLRSQNVAAVGSHLLADVSFQNQLVRFLENHDEQRAAQTFDDPVHKSAAIITYLNPGLRFFYDGQFTGRKAHASVHLGRRAIEDRNADIEAFYQKLLHCLQHPAVGHGHWERRTCHRAWADNPTSDPFLAWTWELAEHWLLVVVNYAGQRGQCRVPWERSSFQNQSLLLQDLMDDQAYVRDGNELIHPGLYVDLPAWGYHVFKGAIHR